MADDALTWPEAYARMQAAGFHTLTGTMRSRLPDGESVRESRQRFWHRLPDRWRVEDEQGVWHVTDGQRQLVRRDGRMEDMSRTHLRFGRDHPRTLFGQRHGSGVEFDWLKDFHTPDGPCEPVEVGARQAWEFSLLADERKRARKPYPLRVVVDEVTGTVLRLAIPEAGYAVELVEFTPDVELAEEIFVCDGPVSTRHREERDDAERVQRWLEEADLPMPRWWPLGLGHHGGDGDPDTGAYRVMLEVPGFPELCRWPAGTAMPAQWKRRQEQRHMHRWSDENWEWALKVEQPLEDEDLAQVIESIPQR